MKILLVYSSVTGNTKKVAEGIYKKLPRNSKLATVKDDIDPNNYDLILIGFWVDKGVADKDAITFMEKVKGKKVGIFGTLGAYPNSEHAKKCLLRTRKLLEPQNEIIGEFICQGKVDPRLLEKIKNLAEGHPHAMTEERRKRHLEASKHPNEEDIKKAQHFFVNIIENISNKEK